MAQDYHKITWQIGFSFFILALTLVFAPLLTFILTRTLSVAEYGVYSLLVVTVDVLIYVLSLGIGEYILTKFPGKSHQEQSKLLFSLLFFVSILVILFSAILIFTPAGDIATSYIKIGEYKTPFIISLAIVFFSIHLLFFSTYFTANHKIEIGNINVFSSQKAWVILLLGFILISNSLNITAIMLLWLSCLVIIVLANYIYFFKAAGKIEKASISFIELKKVLAFSLPLVFFAVGVHIMEIGDRYVLSYYFNTSYVGMYSLGYSLVSLIFGFSLVVLNVLQPYFSKAWNETSAAGTKEYHVLMNMTLKYILLLALPMTVGTFVLRYELVTLISGVKYIPIISVIPYLILFPLFAIFMNVFYRRLLLLNKTKLIGLIYLFGGGLNLILNFILIPKFNMYGAAVATTFSYFVMFLIMYFLCKKHFQLEPKFIRAGRIILSAALMGGVLALMQPTTFALKIIAILLGAGIYLGLLFLFRTFTRKEMDTLFSFILNLKDKLHKSYK
jgi:O-antigen/teichoic acid export membrane protein